MKRFLKKGTAALLSAVMVVTAAPQLAKEVHAAENQLPTKEQFATVEELKSFNTISSDNVPAAKVYFGNNSQQWWIAGSQQEQGLTLFAASPLERMMFNENPYGAGEFDGQYVDANHYGASTIRTKLLELESSYFTDAEELLVNRTTICTNDTKNNIVYSTTDKLYLAYGEQSTNRVTVGENSSESLGTDLSVDKDYWGNDHFWVRMPCTDFGSFGLYAEPSGYLNILFVGDSSNLKPAFELNLSSVLFASAAPAVSSTGDLTLQDTDGDGAFTLRYKADNLGFALVSYDKSKVTLTSVPDGTYLVVQNSTGAKAKQITNETEVSASDMGLDSFKNCKVWLETTDTTNRMTYATLAIPEQGTAVNIVGNIGLNITSNNSSQELAPNTAIAHITVEVTDGYYLPDDYISNLQSQLNGLTVTKIDNGFTISGTPISDVNVTLPAAEHYFIVEGGTEDSDYTYEKRILTFIKDGEYVVRNRTDISNPRDRIVIPKNFKGKLTLDNVTINLDFVPCIDVAGSADLTLMIRGKNQLGVHTDNAAAIQFMNVTDSGRLVIDSEEPEGELKLHGRNGPGIGSPGYGSEYTKNIYINGGIIDVSSDNGIGIGSYSDRYSSEITINGGTIKGSKIGSKARNSSVTINGGNIINELIGETVIDGGFVQGKVNDTEIKNSAGAIVYKANIILENSNVKSLKVDGKDYAFPAQPGTDKIWVYLPVGEHKLTHEDFDGKTYEFTIRIEKDGTAKQVNSWTEELTIQGWKYGENANHPSAKAKFGTVTYTYSSEENGVYTIDVPTNVGTHYIKATVEETNDYTGLESKPVPFEIKKADTTLTFEKDNIDKTYDKNAISEPNVTKTGSNKDVVFAWYSYDGTYWKPLNSTPVNVGTYKVVASVEEDTNYNGTSIEKEFKITSSDSDITIVSDKTTYVYEDQITLDVSVNLAKKQSFFERLFAKDNTVTAYIGDTAISSSVELDKNNHATLRINTKDEKVRELLKPSDQKRIITVKYNGSENLNNTAKDISIMLHKKDTTVSFKDTAFDLSRVYNGKSVTVDVENDIHKTKNAPEVTLNWNTEDGTAFDTAPLKAGKYQLIVSIPEDAYYKGSSVQHNFEISKAELSVKVKVKDKQYDGLNTAEIETVTLVGVAEGDQIKLINGTPTFASVDAGENIAIHFTEFTLEAEEDVLNNYTLIQPTGVTANITNTWIPTKDVEYTTSQPNANGWLKEDFKIQAKEGYLLALGNKADGSRSVNWNKELAGSEEGANSIEFYVKNVKTGAISIGITENYQLDKTKPQVNGLEKDKVYCKEITFTVEETNLDVVKANEKDLTPNEKGVYTLTAGNHRITVVDQAGNETVLAVTVNAEHTPNADDSDCTTPVTCAVCGTIVKEAQEHSFTTYTSDSNAGCLTDGTKTAECDHEGCVQTKTVAEEGSALGHNWGEWETVTSPDCENKGSEKRTCKRCSVTETKDLEASGHAWEEEFTVDQEATCTEEGSKSIHCKKCDAVKDSTSIPATGHSYGKPKWNWNGDGKTVAVTFICQNDSSHVETKTAEVTSAVNKPATCTQAGITTYTATVSFEGNVYTDTKDVANMEALGHDWEEKYTVDKEATCAEEGSKSVHCKNCDEMKDNMVLPATGHKYVHGVCAICEANDPNYKEHEIADGNGSSWNKRDENGLSVQTPGVIGKITDVILSGKPLVEGADYVVNDGTVILKPNVLKELKEGNHTLTIYGEKGYVETQIKIEQNATPVPQNPGNTAKPEKPDDKDPNQETGSPKTGDYANLALWFGLLFASIGSASVTYFYKKKKRN